MSTLDDGGPAFPVTAYAECFAPRSVADERRMLSGMSLRDHFAAIAMQGILSGDHPVCRDPDPLPEIAVVAYKLAEEMLKERAK